MKQDLDRVSMDKLELMLVEFNLKNIFKLSG